MTRKDYKVIAEVFARYQNDITLNFIVHDLATALDKANANFDYDRFVEACGVTTTV